MTLAIGLDRRTQTTTRKVHHHVDRHFFGATGHLGRLTVEQLLARGVASADIVATGRATDKLADLAEQGVRVVAVDRNDPTAVASVIGAGDRVLLVSGIEPNRVEQHRTVIDAAVAAGAAQVVYTSGPFADTSRMLLMADHGATEALLAEAAVPSTVLRNAWYVENYTAQVDTYRAHGLVGAAGDGRVSLALRREYAEAAAVVLTTDGHAGKVYELGGRCCDAARDRRPDLGRHRGAGQLHRCRRRDPADHPVGCRCAGSDGCGVR